MNQLERHPNSFGSLPLNGAGGNGNVKPITDQVQIQSTNDQVQLATQMSQKAQVIFHNRYRKADFLCFATSSCSSYSSRYHAKLIQAKGYKRY